MNNLFVVFFHHFLHVKKNRKTQKFIKELGSGEKLIFQHFHAFLKRYNCEKFLEIYKNFSILRIFRNFLARNSWKILTKFQNAFRKTEIPWNFDHFRVIEFTKKFREICKEFPRIFYFLRIFMNFLARNSWKILKKFPNNSRKMEISRKFSTDC